MATGMILGALAFAAAAIVELKIEVSRDQLLAKGTYTLFFQKCKVFHQFLFFTFKKMVRVAEYMLISTPRVKVLIAEH